MKLFTGFNFCESNVASAVLTYCPNCSRELFFANCRQFGKFAKIRSSRNLSRFQLYSIDFSKAFDKVSHSLLMFKLNQHTHP
ncbi:MAG: hypothetical protein PV344_03735 [Anaplasma sp.]|nr:hypothetical protein [Anaplasma sp.]